MLSALLSKFLKNVRKDCRMNNLLTHDQVALLLLIAIAIGWKANDTVKAIIQYKNDERRKKEYAALENADDHKLCKGPHSWNVIKLCLAPLPVDDYKCCLDCGYISGAGGGFKLNAPALEVYQNELKNRKIRESRMAEYNQALQEGEDKIMNENVKKMLVDENVFFGDLNSRIKHFQHYHRMHKLELRSFWLTLRDKFKDLDV